jgi:probable rRNA maturation factor
MAGSAPREPTLVDPIIGIAVEAGAWSDEDALRSIADEAVTAAVAVLAASGERFPSPPRGPRRGRPRELSIVFTDDAGIRRLNKEFRGQDKATNVLSFPQRSAALLGDVVLAAETVRGEAALAGKPLKDHMAHLIIHGFLHLLGYGHEEDRQAETMEALERAALKRMGIADPYAAA